MPREFPERLMPVGNQGFPDLLTRLGIQPQLVSPFWVLSNVITPVSIVDQNLNIDATVQQFTYEIPAQGGETTNPAANTVLADSGARNVGNYAIQATWAHFTTDNADALWLVRRNAANTADIWKMILSYTTSDQGRSGIFQSQLALDQGERFVIRSSASGIMTGTVQAGLFIHVL